MLAENDIALVFGGGHVGLMGLAADAALSAGGRVIGIIPEFLMAREVGHAACSELHITKTMHDRKQKMAELSDAFVILPGGLGTLDETFEIITWRQLGLHEKPIVIANIDGYWDPLSELVENILEEGYAPSSNRDLIQVVDRIEDILPEIEASPNVPGDLETKWI